MKKVIVVGATSGIGYALAGLFAADGYRVGITGRRNGLLAALQEKNPGIFITGTFDITDTGTIAAHLEALVSALGGLDLLVISSGTGDLNDTLDFEIEKRTIDVNVAGFTCIADWTFNYFIKQKYQNFIFLHKKQ